MYTKCFLTCIAVSLLAQFYSCTVADQHQEEYCLLESFHPKCAKNNVLLMTSALLGRMRIGRCITAEEVSRLRTMMGEDPQYLGCSADVLPTIAEKCSGKSECEIRVGDIPAENNVPCLPGLKTYLEVSYVCIKTADESRSCTVAATSNPVHIIVSENSQKICGTKSQPWIIEANSGKRIKTALVELNGQSSEQVQAQRKTPCYGNGDGVIIDRIGKRNVSICRDHEKRETLLHSSVGNTVNIILNDKLQSSASDSKGTFLIKIEAIGCSDIVPPEDTWLKRSDDMIAIGCYSSRQTWRLNCQDGKWIGVLGNCSVETFLSPEKVTSEEKTTISKDEQILGIVAIVGCTLAICMAIVCIGAVCLRRYHEQSKRDQTYKTLSCNYDTNGDNGMEHTQQRLGPHTAMDHRGNGINGFSEPQIPTYSVYVADGTMHDPTSVKQ